MTPAAALLYMAIGLVFIAGVAVIAGILWLAFLAAYILIMGAIAAGLLWSFQGQADHDATALANVCDPCHGKPGRCCCTEKCEWELCGADDTGVHDITAELEAWFREGGQR